MFESKLEELKKLCSTYLLSKNDFVISLNNILQEEFSPVENFLYIINANEPLEDIYIGDTSLNTTNQYNHKSEIWNDINNSSISTIQMLIKLKDGERFNSYDIFENIFKAYWRDQSPRLAKSLLLPDADGDMPKMLDLSIRKAINDNYSCAILYADIDKFGNFNNTYNHETGDTLISKISVAIQKHTENSIPIHSHGDEFAVVHISKNIAGVLSITNDIRNEIKNIKIKHKDSSGETVELQPEVSLSFGIYIIDKNNYDPSQKYSDYLSKAEHALVPNGPGSKERGKVRVYSTNMEESFEVSMKSLKQSLIQSKINLLNQRPFSNIWLNFITKYVGAIEDLSIDNFNKYFQEIIDIVSPEFTDINISSIPHHNFNTTHALSLTDIMISFLSGAVVNNFFDVELKNILIKYDVQNHSIKLLLDSDIIIDYSYQSTVLEDFSEIEILEFPKLIGSKTSMDGKISNSLLIIIGNEYDEILGEIFNTVINVDNRPMTGGGLPDFWEAAIAHLVNSISNNKNIKNVLVLGDPSHTTKISKLLDGIKNDTVEDLHNISYKIGYDSSSVNEIFKILIDRIYFIENEDEELISVLFEKEFSENNSFSLMDIDYSHPRQKKGYLKQKVNLEEFRLDEYDGCRGETLRKIYPVVINNIREIDLPINTDFSNKKFKELTDFKIILTKPSEDTIPWFYENDKESFEKYFSDNFSKEEGIFYQKLNANNQVNVVINHIVEHLKKSNKKKIINTRRAIIILDNEINENKLEPVGLISIRIYHNLNSDGSISINFTYVWRTVEVIVGLPYSMYGSIQYSNFLLQKIIKKLEDEANFDINIKNIKLGSLTYIAQSLHIFKDSYSENIAKNIVDEATI